MDVLVALCCSLIVALAIYAAGLYAAALSFLWGRATGRGEAEAPDADEAVTVIVPARNEGAMALRVIQSLLDQDTRRPVHVHVLFEDRSDSSWPFLQAAFGVEGAGARTGAGSVVLLEAREGYAGLRTVAVGFVGAGGKADKINWLLPRVTTPLVAVLDCDHQAHPDWLRRAAHRMRSRGARMVQGRRQGLAATGLFSLWDSLHQHVGCELYNAVFMRHGLSVFFTGTTVVAETALLQRHPLRACITEDIELSYTLFMEGERVVSEPIGGSDEEVSPDLYSFLARRRRWANGHTDAFVRHLGRLRRAPLRWRDRVQFLFHGVHYLVAGAVSLLHLGVGALFAATLPAGAVLLALGLGVFGAVAVAKTQRTTSWRTRASEVVVLTGWFLPAAIMLTNVALAWLTGDAQRLVPPLPEPFLVIGLFALAAPLVVLLAGLFGFGMLTPTTALVVTASYPVAFYLDIAGVLIGLVDWLAGRSLWLAVARAARVARPVTVAAPGAGAVTLSGGAAEPQAPEPLAPEPVGVTGVSLSPVVSIPESWRLPAIGALLKRTVAMTLPKKKRPVRLVIWLTLIGLLVGGFVASRASRLTVAAADCTPLPHDGDPWIVQPHLIPGYCETPAPPEGERWSRRRSRFEAPRVDRLTPLERARWERLGTTFECNLVRFAPDNVQPAEGGGVDLVLRAQDAGDRRYTSGAIATHDRPDGEHRFGRFEVELRAAKGSGLITAFFLHRRDPWQEIDVEILGRDPTKLLANVYYNPGVDGDLYNYGFSGTPALIELGFDASEGFHRYAIEWDLDELRWFVDDRLVHRRRAGRPTPIPHLPMRLHASLWANCSEALVGPFSGERLPAIATVRSIGVAPSAPSLLYPVWDFYDGLFGDGPNGPRPEPALWQDEAEWLQRTRPAR
ncbi:MAG: family 16 glycosylhydrolase [Deltaproteobacteria bacterium]|nr:family 16 glycosylhydrolase [Deltaproteobacteria bacterium]